MAEVRALSAAHHSTHRSTQGKRTSEASSASDVRVSSEAQHAR